MVTPSRYINPALTILRCRLNPRMMGQVVEATARSMVNRKMGKVVGVWCFPIHQGRGGPSIM